MQTLELDKKKIYFGEKIARKKWWLNRLASRANKLSNFPDFIHSFLVYFHDSKWQVIQGMHTVGIEKKSLKDYLLQEKPNELYVCEIALSSKQFELFVDKTSTRKTKFDAIGLLDSANMENRSILRDSSLLDKLLIIIFGWVAGRIIKPSKEKFFCSEFAFLGAYIACLSEQSFFEYLKLDPELSFRNPAKAYLTSSAPINAIIKYYNELDYMGNGKFDKDGIPLGIRAIAKRLNPGAIGYFFQQTGKSFVKIEL